MMPVRPDRRTAIARALAGACALAGGLDTARAAASAAAAAGRGRLVTVGGALTECVYALQAGDLLVACDSTSSYPAPAQALPKVGYLRSLSAEGLLSLRPTAVLASAEAGPTVVLDQLRSAGVSLYQVPSTHNWEEVRQKVIATGRATARPLAATRLLGELDGQWAQAQARVPRRTDGPRVLFILAHAASPSISGEGTAAHALIELLGARNAVGGFTGYRPLTAEAMAQAAPDVILTSTEGLQAQGGIERFWSRPEMPLAPAYRRRSLVHLDALQLLGFGPRLPQVVQALVPQIHG